MRVLASVCATLTFVAVPLAAQSGRIAGDRKTIEIRASDKISTPAEVATVKIGFQNSAAGKDGAYEEKVRVSNKIVQALRAAGTPAAAIETESIRLEREDTPPGVKPASTRYSADEEWRVRIKASEAQKIVDIAVAAGANQVGGVEWSVADPDALESKAYAAALARARRVAEQTASQAGVKLGEIVSISNFVPSFITGWNPLNSSETITVSAAPVVTSLKLFPEDVSREASVTVVYAIAP